MIDILTYNDIVKNVCVYGLDESVKASKYPMSDDPEEIVRMVGFANDYISMLAYNRMIQLRGQANE